MTGIGDFQYIDFASRGMQGFRNNVTQVEELPSLTKRYGHTDCYCTYFLFDQGLCEHIQDNGHSVSGYQGSCYAHYLPLDIDSPDLGRALETARDITRYLFDNWGVTEQTLAVYFSGMKGFHITVATEAFGEVQPGTELPGVFREVRQSIVQKAAVKHPETVDFSISDRMRLLRLPNTRHSKSGLYKVPLQMEELLSCEPEEIRSIAQKPRRLWLTDESGLIPRYCIEPVPDAVDLFEHCTDQAEKLSHADLPDPGSFLNNGDLKETLCEAELELYREGVPEGSRSAMCLRLASRFRSAGHTQQEASEMVESFAGRCRPPLQEHTARQVVVMAYKAGGKGYQFGCGNGNGNPAHTRLVHERCGYKTDRIKCDTFRQFYLHLNGNGGKGAELL